MHYWNRFDICAAYYLFLSQYHEDQWSEKYRRLSRLLTYYKPSPLLRDEDDLEDNAKAIYDNLVAQETTQ